MEDQTQGPFLEQAAAAIDRHVGERLRRQRVHHGLSLRTVAQALGVPDASVEQWERGQIRVPAAHLLALSRLFSCPLATFFEGLPTATLGDDPDAMDGDVASFISRHFSAKH